MDITECRLSLFWKPPTPKKNKNGGLNRTVDLENCYTPCVNVWKMCEFLNIDHEEVQDQWLHLQ